MRKTKSQRANISIRRDTLRRAHIAASLTGESLVDFVSEATDRKSAPVLKKHGVKGLPDAVSAASTHA